MKVGWTQSKASKHIFILFIILALLAAAIPAQAQAGQPSLSVPLVEGQPGTAIQVPVNLDSSGQVQAVQFDLGFDSQLLEYQGVEAGNSGVEIQANQLASGSIRVILYNSAGISLPGGSGTAANFSFLVRSGAQPGQSCALELLNVVVSDAQGNQIEPVSLTSGQFTVASLVLSAPELEGRAGSAVQVPVNLTSSGQVGALQFDLLFDEQLLLYQGVAPGALIPGYTVEANQLADGKVRVIICSPGNGALPAGSDSIAVLNFLVAGGASPGSSCPLDLDGAVLSDAGGNPLLPVALRDGLFRVSSLLLQVPVVEGHPLGLVQVPVSLTSEGQVGGLQFDLSFDGQLLQYQGAAVGSLPQGYSVEANQLPSGKVRLIVHGQKGSSYIPGGTVQVALLGFAVSGSALPGQSCPLDLSNAVASDSSGGSIQAIDLIDGQFRVKDAVELEVSPKNLNLYVGGPTGSINVSALPPGVTVDFISDSPSIALVDVSGTVTAVSHGSAVITVTASKAGYVEATETVAVSVSCGKGDVNCDGEIDILDVVMVIDIALEKLIPTPAQFFSADVNEDGVIDVLDVVIVIDMALE
ncbi:MAG: cohesin domain-containing protein [Desulfocucumaceae bacterium]